MLVVLFTFNFYFLCIIQFFMEFKFGLKSLPFSPLLLSHFSPFPMSVHISCLKSRPLSLPPLLFPLPITLVFLSFFYPFFSLSSTFSLFFSVFLSHFPFSTFLSSSYLAFQSSQLLLSSVLSKFQTLSNNIFASPSSPTYPHYLNRVPALCLKFSYFLLSPIFLPLPPFPSGQVPIRCLTLPHSFPHSIPSP